MRHVWLTLYMKGGRSELTIFLIFGYADVNMPILSKQALVLPKDKSI
jgi:hypothetical protein